MTREEALRLSEALVAAGIGHGISVRVADNLMPRESYSVKPYGGPLTTPPEQIEAVQAVARAAGYRLALIGGRMELVK